MKPSKIRAQPRKQSKLFHRSPEQRTWLAVPDEVRRQATALLARLLSVGAEVEAPTQGAEHE